MFCEKCGRPTEEGQTLCTECATEQTPKQEASAFTVNTNPEEPPKKKGLLGWIIGGVALVAAIVAAIFIFGGEPETPAEPKTLSENVVEAAGAAYGSLLESLQAPAGATKHTVTITAGEELTGLLETLLASQDMQVELSWLKSITLQVTGGQAENAAGADLGIGLNGKNLLTLKAFLDLAEKELYATIPELNEAALKLTLNEEDLGIDTSELGGLVNVPQEMAASLVKDLPDQAAFEAALKSYITLILDTVKEGQKEQKSIAVGEASQQVTATTWQLSEQDVLNTVIAVLEKAKTDETVKQFITAFCNYANNYASSLTEEAGVSVEALKPDTILAQIPELIEDLKAVEAEDTKITIVLYTDEQNTLRGMLFKDTEDKTVLDYRRVTAGDKTVMELVLPDEIVLKGETTADTTRVELVVETESMVTVYLETIDGTKTIRIVPGTALMEALSEDVPVLGMASGLELRLSRKEGAMNVELWLNGKCFLGFSYAAAAGEAYTPVKPEKAASADNGLALMGWASKLNFDSLIQSLKDAGMPQNYLDSLKGLIGQLVGLGGLASAA